MHDQISNQKVNFRMRLLTHLLCVCVSKPAFKPTGDLSPPFYPNEKGRVGYWDIGGAGVAFEDVISLTPPVQWHKGYAWYSLPPPEHVDWSIDFRLRMAEGTGGGGFGIWMINQHGSDGHFYGGPEVFFGAVIVGAVFPVNGTREIRFRCVQSSFTIRATPMAADEEASYVMPLDDSWFVLRLDVSSTHIALSKVVDDQVSLLLNESLTLDLSEAWLGLTGLSADRTSRIELNYAKFGDSALREGILAQQRKVGSRSQRVLPLTNRELRNPIFSLMLSELEQWKAADGQIGNLSKDFDQVFAHLNEFWTVFEDVATYKQLSSFVKKTLIPYAQDWHRRAFKVVESVSEAKIILSKAFNKTAALVSVFNESVSEMVEKTDRKVVRLRELVIGDENDAFSGLRNVGHEIGVVGFVDVLKWIGFSEIGILTLFYIYQSVAGRNRR